MSAAWRDPHLGMCLFLTSRGVHGALGVVGVTYSQSSLPSSPEEVDKEGTTVLRGEGWVLIIYRTVRCGVVCGHSSVCVCVGEGVH